MHLHTVLSSSALDIAPSTFPLSKCCMLSPGGEMEDSAIYIANGLILKFACRIKEYFVLCINAKLDFLLCKVHAVGMAVGPSYGILE